VFFHGGTRHKSAAVIRPFEQRLTATSLNSLSRTTPLMWLVGTFHAILKLAVTFRQFFGDDVCASWNVPVKWIKKHDRRDLEGPTRASVQLSFARLRSMLS
jgi:hypothetical protein